MLIYTNMLSLQFQSLAKSLLLFSGKVFSPAFHELSPGQHPEGMRHYWNHQRTTGQAEFGNEPISHFHFGPQKQRKTIMKKGSAEILPPFPRKSHLNHEIHSLARFCHRHWTAPVPSFSERCSKTWKCWSLDKMIKRLHHREHKCKHYPWVCYFAIKVQYKPFPPTPNQFFCWGFLWFFVLS